MRESNSRQRFWRPLSYHLTNPLYCNSLLSAYYLYHISSIYVNRIFHFFIFLENFCFFLYNPYSKKPPAFFIRAGDSIFHLYISDIHFSKYTDQNFTDCKNQNCRCNCLGYSRCRNSSHYQSPYGTDCHIFCFCILFCKKNVDTSHYRDRVHHCSGESYDRKCNDIVYFQF